MRATLSVAALMSVLCLFGPPSWAFQLRVVRTGPLYLQGYITKVQDGDTMTLADGAREVKIRLYGVDAPELRQPSGKEAQAFTMSKVLRKWVFVRQVDVDRYGRVVGDVTIPGYMTLSQALVHAGLAWWYPDYAKDDLLLESMQDGARALKLGLWQESQPVAPWLWREQK